MLPNHLCNYGSGPSAEHFCESVLNLEVVQEEKLFKDDGQRPITIAHLDLKIVS